MARMNEILVGRFNRALQKLSSIKGPPPAAQLASEIGAQFTFNQMGADFRYLEGWNYYGGFVQAIGSAGNSPTIRMTNDIGTNVVAVIEKISVSLSAAGQVSINYAAPAVLTSGHVGNLGSATSVPGLDTRLSQTTSQISGSVCILSSTPTANSIGSALWAQLVPAAVTTDVLVDLMQELPFLPQSALNLIGLPLASTMIVNFMWRERFLEDSERT